MDQGVEARAVGYAKGLGDGPLDGVSEILSRNDIHALGLVVDKVGRIMHGMEAGHGGHAQPGSAVGRRRVHGGASGQAAQRRVAVYLTSDHGNIEAEGRGRPSEGAVADVRG